jgi:outer membrane protein OmpA-like peptidoglycan-associated protein
MKTASRSSLAPVALVAALAGAAAALPAKAADTTDQRGQASVQSDVGVVTGLAVGAAAAGPVGAMVGAAAGALIGDSYHRQKQSAATLAQHLSASETERSRLNERVTELSGSLSQSEARERVLDQQLQQADDTGLDVSFRTDDDSVTAQAMSPLLKLGALVASLPQARVRIAGFADARGPQAYNEDLSRRRAENVAAVLACAGVPRERMLIEAHGRSESKSAAGDLDAYALERRVTVRVQLPPVGQQVARND